MPVPMAAKSPQAGIRLTHSQFPAKQKRTSGIIHGVETEIATISFTDKILLTISQEGRLAYWVHVPLESTDPNGADRRLLSDDPDSQLLPMPHLTASTILGATVPERDTVGHLLGTQIASAIATQNPEEKRLLVVGMGLEKAELDRTSFLEILELVLQCI